MNDSTNNPKTVSDLYPSKYLRADDLKGRVFELTVKEVKIEKLQGIQGEHLCAVLYFDKAQKGMALNKTQCLAMSKITGTEFIDKWEGARISLRSGMAQNHKATVIIDYPTKKGMD